MSEQEEREVQRLVKATSEPLDVVSRAKVLVAVASGSILRRQLQRLVWREERE
jgi:hypothetical protein